jgi:hypothetical protein
MSDISYQPARKTDTDTRSPSLQIPVPAFQNNQTPSLVESWLGGLPDTTTGQEYGDPPAHEDGLGTGVSHDTTHNSVFHDNAPGHEADNPVPSQRRWKEIQSELSEHQANIQKACISNAERDMHSALTGYSQFVSELDKDELNRVFDQTFGITPEARKRWFGAIDTMVSQGTPFPADGNDLNGMSFFASEYQPAQITADNGSEQALGEQMRELLQQGEFDPGQLGTLLAKIDNQAPLPMLGTEQSFMEELAAYHAQPEPDNGWQALKDRFATLYNEESIQEGSVWSEERYDPKRRPSCASDRTS